MSYLFKSKTIKILKEFKMSIGPNLVITSGEEKDGEEINETGTFLNFESAFNVKASYIALNNRNTNGYSVFVNINRGAIDNTRDNKTFVCAPGSPLTIADGQISDATIFSDTGETEFVDYAMGIHHTSFLGQR